MKIVKSISILSTILLLGCLSNQKENPDKINSAVDSTSQKNKVERLEEDNVKTKVFISSLPKIEYIGDSLKIDKNIKEFENFILLFENEIAQKDYLRVKSLTNFPFETRGLLDDYPHVFYSKSNFISVLNAFLSHDVGINLNDSKIGKEFSSYIRSSRMITLTDDWAGIEDMKFKKVNGKWKLYFVYLSDEAIEELKNVPQQSV